MESERMENMDFISNLPEDLLSRILMKLPVKDLIHLLSVSKLFKALITGSDFVYHYNKVQVMTPTTRSNFLSICQTHHCVPSGWCWFREWKYIATPFKLFATFDLLGSSAGVVCLLDFDDTDNSQVIPILWNPSINRFKLVPASKQITNHVLFGFGFDHVNNEYKVVMILYKSNNNDLDAQVLIYGTKTGYWRTLHQTTVPCFLGFDRRHAEGVITKTTTTCVNGVVYWPAHKSTTSVHCDCIMGFDVVHEVFNVVELPDQPAEQIELCTSSDQKFLAMFVSPNNNRSLKWRWNVWFMCDNTWQKQYSMELKRGIFTPLEILKNGEILARLKKDMHALVFTGDKEEEIKNLSVCRPLTPLVTGYTPSLALLDHHDSTAGCKLEDNVPCRKRPRFDN